MDLTRLLTGETQMHPFDARRVGRRRGRRETGHIPKGTKLVDVIPLAVVAGGAPRPHFAKCICVPLAVGSVGVARRARLAPLGRRNGSLANQESEHGDAVREDDTDGCAIGDDDVPATWAHETSHTTPAVRRCPGEVDFETAASNVRDGSTRVTGDRGDDTEQGLARRDRDQTEVVIERLLAAYDEGDALADRRRLVAGRDHNAELRRRSRTHYERDEAGEDERLHASTTPKTAQAVPSDSSVGGSEPRGTQVLPTGRPRKRS